MKRILWLLEIALFGLLVFPVAVLPLGIGLKAGEFLGLLLFSAWGSRRKIAVENIEKALKVGRAEAEEIAKRNFMNLGRSLVEIGKIYCGLGKKVIDAVEIKGGEHYVRAKAKGKGVIFITGHCGNWELMALTFGARMDAISNVARVQNNPYVNRMLEKARRAYGNGLIYKKGALKGIFSLLKKNGTVGILMDQAVIKDEGFIIDFLGRGAWTTKMPALIARKTGAPVLPAFINRVGDRHVMTLYPEVVLSGEADGDKAVIEDTKRFTGFVEEYIKLHPTEWLWIHRRWKRAGIRSQETLGSQEPGAGMHWEARSQEPGVRRKD